jgi:hypothetical protein
VLFFLLVVVRLVDGIISDLIYESIDPIYLRDGFLFNEYIVNWLNNCIPSITNYYNLWLCFCSLFPSTKLVRNSLSYSDNLFRVMSFRTYLKILLLVSDVLLLLMFSLLESTLDESEDEDLHVMIV